MTVIKLFKGLAFIGIASIGVVIVFLLVLMIVPFIDCLIHGEPFL